MNGMMEGLDTMLESVEVVALTTAAVIQLPLILITGLRLRSWIGFWVVTLMVTTTVQFLLWPIPHSLFVDDVTHVKGLGFFLFNTVLWVTLSCYVVYLGVLSGNWGRRLKVSIAIISALAVVQLPIWLFMSRSVQGNSETLIYQCCYIHPAPLLIWNIYFPIATIIICIIAMKAVTVKKEEANRLLLLADSSSKSTLVFGIVYGSLMLGQVVMTRLGLPPTMIMPILHLLRVIAVLGYTISAFSIYLIAPMWPNVKTWGDLHQKEMRAEAAINRMLLTYILVSESLAEHRKFVDKNVATLVYQRCRTVGLSHYQGEVAAQATRLTIAHRARKTSVVTRPRGERDVAVFGKPFLDEDAAVDAEAHLEGEGRLFFISDVWITMALLHKPHLRLRRIWDTSLSWRPSAWHRTAATIITDVLVETSVLRSPRSLGGESATTEEQGSSA